MTIKKVGLDLLQDAEQRLTIYPKDYPNIQLYKTNIDRLKQFFQEFDEATFQWQQQLERVDSLKKEIQTEKKPHQKVLLLTDMVNSIAEAEKTMPDNEEAKKTLAKNYGSLAWYQLSDKQFAAAEVSARTGLEKDSSEIWINTNLALALMYQGKWEQAKQIYQTLQGEPYKGKTYRETFLADLATLEQEGITHKDFARVRALLK